MSKTKLDEIKERHEWHEYGNEKVEPSDVAQDIAYLLARVEELEGENADLVNSLHQVIDNGVPGALYEGSYEHRMRQELEKIAESYRSALKTIKGLGRYACDTQGLGYECDAVAIAEKALKEGGGE